MSPPGANPARVAALIAADNNGIKFYVALEDADTKAGTVDSVSDCGICVARQNADMKLA